MRGEGVVAEVESMLNHAVSLYIVDITSWKYMLYVCACYIGIIIIGIIPFCQALRRKLNEASLLI